MSGECEGPERIKEKVTAAKINAAHLRALSSRCMEQGIPAPLAAMHSKKAAYTLKGFGIEDKSKSPRCQRCYLDFSTKGSFSLRIIKPKKPKQKTLLHVRKNGNHRFFHRLLKKREESKAGVLVAVCAGCGTEMKCGKLSRQTENSDEYGKNFDSSLLSSNPSPSFRTTEDDVPSIAGLKRPFTAATPSSFSSIKRPVGSSRVPSTSRKSRRSNKLQKLLLQQDAENAASSGGNDLLSFLNSFKV